MRRPLIAVMVVALSAGGAGQGAAALAIEPTAVRMLVPAASGGGESPPAFAARVGGEYRFEVAYTVAGAPRIATGHRFVFENAVTGERKRVLARRFPPDEPGAYNESGRLTVPASWSPGVYRFLWTVRAGAPGEAPASISGTRVFLVVG